MKPILNIPHCLEASFGRTVAVYADAQRRVSSEFCLRGAARGDYSCC